VQGTGQMTSSLEALRLATARLEQRKAEDRAQAGTPCRFAEGTPSRLKPSGTRPSGTGPSRDGEPQARSGRRSACAGTRSPGPEADSIAPALRATIASAETRSVTVLRFGIAAIDAHLPAGGLNRAALHELAGVGPDTEHGATPALLVAALLARHPGQVLWATEHRDLFAPALAAVGLHPDRIVFAEAGRSVLAVMEEGLRHPGLAAVVGELSGPLGLSASRRLQLGAEAGVPAFLLRRSRRFDDPLLSAPSAAATRWRVSSLHMRPVRIDAPGVPGVGRACWHLDLVRCRGGMPSSWTLEACDAQNRLGLAAELRHGPAAAFADGNRDGRKLQDHDSSGDAEQMQSGWSRGAAGGVAA
jgi:protein ImuA